MPRRQRLHGRSALAVETLYAATLAKHASMLAHHFYQAGAGADVGKTADYLVQAAEQARASAGHEDALEYLDNALGLWDGDRSERTADLLDRRAAALDSLGRTRDAIDVAKEAAVLWHELDRYERYAASVWKVGIQLNWVMDLDAALVAVERAQRVLQGAPSSLRLPLLYLQAVTLSTRGAVAEALEKLAEADDGRAPLADPYVQTYEVSGRSGPRR